MKRRGIPLPASLTTSRSSGFEEFRDDPVGFVRTVLGIEPWAVQQQILHALATEPRVSVRSCNGAGKTICAAWATLWFLFTRPGSIVITTAPTGQQVKNLLWRRLRDAFGNARVPLPGRCLTGMLECGADWYALGLSTDKEVNFQGPHSSAGVLMVGDEASGLAEWMFSAMAGSMTEPGAKMLLIGNPNYPMGTFYDSQRLWPQAQRFHISAFDVPAHVLRPTWKEECLRDWGADSPLYQVRVMGEFPDQAPDSLIRMSWIVEAQERSTL